MWRSSDYSRLNQLALKSVFAVIMVLSISHAAFAGQSVALSWNPTGDPAVAGYKIYYGPASRQYTNSIALGNITRATLASLADSATYFFAATTYDSAGVESDYSNEASFVTPAAITIPVIPVIPPETNSVPTNNPPVTPPVTNTPPVVDPPVIITNPPPALIFSPSLNAISNLTLNANSPMQSIAITGITSGTTAVKSTPLRITVASSNPSLVKPTASYISPKTFGALNFKPAPNASGTAIITVTINNGAKSNNLASQSFTITVLPPPPSLKALAQMPKFSRHLTNCFALKGKNISMTVAATGRAPLRYQWSYNGTPITGATSPVLTLKNASANRSGFYSVNVSNPLGSTNSVAQIAVYDSTAANLATKARAENGNFRFQVGGIPGYTYVVQASTDMKNWSSVQTNTAPFTFEDVETTTYGQRYYRSFATQ